MVGTDYVCHMSVRNPLGNQFSAIEGDHLSGRGNADVRILDIVSSNTRNVPEIICQQFPQVTRMLIYDDFVETINQQAFAACANLELLHLGRNLITIVPVNTFANSPRLRELYLGTNLIRTIHPTSFTGTVIDHLDLSDNFLGTVNSLWFQPITQTLRSLDLLAARITNIPVQAFSNLTGLTALYLNMNSLTGLDGKKFFKLFYT
jgi:Leucine-rich repeat (LRR) protein